MGCFALRTPHLDCNLELISRGECKCYAPRLATKVSDIKLRPQFRPESRHDGAACDTTIVVHRLNSLLTLRNCGTSSTQARTMATTSTPAQGTG